MASKIHDEQLKLDIIINGNNAQKKLGDLHEQERRILKTQKELRAQAIKLKAAGEQQSDAYKNLTKEIKNNISVLNDNKEKQKALRQEIGITALSTKQLRKEQKRLKAIISGFAMGTPQWQKYNTQLQKVEGQLTKVRYEMKGTNTIIGKMKRNLTSFTGVLAAVGFYQVVGKIKKLVSANADLSESQTDVQKTTELTDKEITKLTKNLKKFKTRSTVNELLAIAEQAGRLGKRGVTDIQAFVKEADKIKVALGDDLQGSVEENIRVIGKLTENYGVAQKQGVSFSEGMGMVGSAINEVSAKGSNQASFLVDYLNRLVGVSKQTKITADAQIGYAAVLDESGQSVEVSGTTMSKVMFNMFKDTKTYAKIAGVGVKDFSKLMKKDANEAFLLFLKGLDGNGEGLQKMTKKLDGLGLKGARSIGVLTALASQTDKIRKKQTVANRALKENNSLTEEFNNKNSNLPALLERINNWFSNLFTGGWISNSLQNIVLWFAKLVGVADDTDGSMAGFKSTVVALFKVIVIGITALVSYKTAIQLVELWAGRSALAIKLNTMAAKANASAMVVGKGAALLFKAAMYAITGQTKKAAIAMRAFSIVTKLSPIGLLIGAITAGAVAYALYAKKIKEVNIAQKLLNNAKTKALKSVAKERSELDRLLSIAKDETLSKKERLRAIKQLNKISPKYLGGLTLENVTTEDGIKLTEKYIEALNNKAIAQALQEKRVELYKKMVDEETKSIKNNVSWGKALWINIKNLGDTTKASLEAGAEGLVVRYKNIEAIKKEIAVINDLQKKYKVSPESSIKPYKPTSNNTPNEDPEVDPTNSNELTKEDQRIIDSKKRLAEFLKEWEIEQDIQKKLLKFDKEQRDEEEEVLRTQMKFQKMAEDAGFETTLAAGLEEAKNLEIQTIRDKWNEIRLAKQKANDAKYAAADKKLKSKLVKAEKQLELAQAKIRNLGVGSLKKFFGEKTTLYKMFLGLEKAMAISDVLINTSKANAQITSNLAIANMKAVATSPLTGGLPYTAINTAIATKEMTTNKINAAINVAQIVGSAIQGFEDGLYPVTRTDGKKFNAKMGGATQTQIISEPTLIQDYLVGERRRPEMIIDDVTFSKLDPKVISYILNVHNGTSSTGYETGKYNTSSATETTTLQDTETADFTNPQLAAVLNRLNAILDAGIKAQAVIGYQEAQDIKDITDEIDNSKQNGTLA